MATINGLYIFVEEENLSYGVTVTEHTVETGIEISDHVKRNAIQLSLSGEIVGENATSVLGQLREIHNSGKVCKYSGRVTLSNCLITEISTTQTHSIWGGYAFTMTLKEVRTASTSYKKAVSTGKKLTSTQQVVSKSKESNVYHTVKKGDTIWGLVAASKAPYKNLSRPNINGKKYAACSWVMAKNPKVFSKKGDYTTLQVGKKLVVGVRAGAAQSKSGNSKADFKVKE